MSSASALAFFGQLCVAASELKTFCHDNHCVLREPWERSLANVRWSNAAIVVGDLCEYHPELNWRQCDLPLPQNISAMQAQLPAYASPPVTWPELPPAGRWKRRGCALEGPGPGAPDGIDGFFSGVAYHRVCDLFLDLQGERCRDSQLVSLLRDLKQGSVVCARRPEQLLRLLHSKPAVVSARFVLVTAFHMAMMFPRKPDMCPSPGCFAEQPWAVVQDEWLEHPMLHRWFSFGMTARHPKLVGMPIGGDDSIPNFDVDALRKVPKTRLLHAVFCAYHHPLRSAVLRHVVGLSGGHEGLAERFDACPAAQRKTPAALREEMEGQREWLEELAQYRFVLCPPGTGEDTFRLWQALHVGSFPVVLEPSHIPDWSSIWDNLPIVRLQRLEDLTLERLDAEFSRLSAKDAHWAWERTAPGYWIERIRREAKLAAAGMARSQEL